MDVPAVLVGPGTVGPTMRLLMTDAVTQAEVGVIIGCASFLAWWYSPAQRSRRRREDARIRIAVRHTLRGRQ